MLLMFPPAGSLLGGTLWPGCDRDLTCTDWIQQPDFNLAGSQIPCLCKAHSLRLVPLAPFMLSAKKEADNLSWSHFDTSPTLSYSKRAGPVIFFFFSSKQKFSSHSHALKSCMCFFIYPMWADYNPLLHFSSLPLGAYWPFSSVSPDLLLLLVLCSFHHLALLPSTQSTGWHTTFLHRSSATCDLVTQCPRFSPSWLWWESLSLRRQQQFKANKDG